mgnify:CR=1 FL=1
MIEKYSIRTDLALEQKERFESDNVEVQGVVLEEDYDEEREIKVTTVKIETENGAKTMGKPVGTYITMERRIWRCRMKTITRRYQTSWQNSSSGS